MIKKQENPPTTKALREVVEQPKAAATSTTEYKAYLIQQLILQSNNRTRIAEKRSNSWFSENHPNKESFLQDMKHTEKINAFRERSKKLITDMGNTEIFELCETSSKTQCPDCSSPYWNIGIVYCSCGRSLIPSQRTKQVDKKNCDAFSIPSYVIKKGIKHGAKHGGSERQRKHRKAKQMLQKARQPKHGGYPSILERWHNEYDYRNSFVTHRVDRGPHHPARQTCTGRSLSCCHAKGKSSLRERLGTLVEYRRCSTTDEPTSWFCWSKKITKTTWWIRERNFGGKYTESSYTTNKTKKDQQFEGLEENDYRVDPQTGWRTYPSRPGWIPTATNIFVLVNSMGSGRLLEV